MCRINYNKDTTRYVEYLIIEREEGKDMELYELLITGYGDMYSECQYFYKNLENVN